ncbi:MAG: Uncharacterized protein JWN46_457 [Acidimicrobiales bacterium]|nr:Uncharacterized protein [Acidimicrobiales bacterium]
MANAVGILVVLALITALVVRQLTAPWARQAVGRWQLIKPWLITWVLSSPATFVYLAVLIVTSWVVDSSNSRVAESLLLNHSTNVTRLQHQPVNVLVTSAFYDDGSTTIVWVLAFALVVATVERWIGSARTIAVFFMGHVIATLVAAIGVSLAISQGRLQHLRHVVDVGVSYGFYALAAVAAYRLRGWMRWAWILLLEGLVVSSLFDQVSFTEVGHIVAVQVGLVCWPLTRSPDALARREEPLLRLAPWRVQAVRSFEASFRGGGRERKLDPAPPAPTASEAPRRPAAAREVTSQPNGARTRRSNRTVRS